MWPFKKSKPDWDWEEKRIQRIIYFYCCEHREPLVTYLRVGQCVSKDVPHLPSDRYYTGKAADEDYNYRLREGIFTIDNGDKLIAINKDSIDYITYEVVEDN